MSPLLGDMNQCDNPGLVAGNTSSSRWGCPGEGKKAPKSFQFSKKISLKIVVIRCDLGIVTLVPISDDERCRPRWDAPAAD
jgi:hypothetical protein